jgi:hypothetical protein
MVFEYKSFTRTGSKPVSGTGKATRNTFSGSAGLAFGLGAASPAVHVSAKDRLRQTLSKARHALSMFGRSFDATLRPTTKSTIFLNHGMSTYTRMTKIEE